MRIWGLVFQNKSVMILSVQATATVSVYCETQVISTKYCQNCRVWFYAQCFLAVVGCVRHEAVFSSLIPQLVP